jgi:hypothetical protein
MCPHACSRVSVPAANRLKYSEPRNGFCASSSVLQGVEPLLGIHDLSAEGPGTTPALREMVESKGFEGRTPRITGNL